MSSTIKLITTPLQPRPEHQLPKNIHEYENQCLIEILGNDHLSLASAVVQILFALNNRWEKQVCGVLCFIKDSKDRCYLFQMFDLKKRSVIYDFAVPATTQLEKCTDLFYTFDGATCKVGINFVDCDEAQAFFHHFRNKQEARQARRAQRTLAKHVPTHITENLTSEPKSPRTSHDDKNKSGGLKKFLTMGRKTKIEISAPVEGTFDHRNGITIDGSFFKDDECRGVFERKLVEMNLSVDEVTFIREKFNGKQSFEKFVKKRQRTKESYAPLSPVSQPKIERNPNVRRPFQDIAISTYTHFQTATSVVETTKTSIPPPIPIRNHQQPVVVTPNPIPVAPPLPPPPPPPGPVPPSLKPSADSNPVTPQAKGSPGGMTAVFDDITSGLKTLKPVCTQPPKPPVIENFKLTMEEYILQELEKRRCIIMGRKQADDEEEEEEEDDGFDDDFD